MAWKFSWILLTWLTDQHPNEFNNFLETNSDFIQAHHKYVKESFQNIHVKVYIFKMLRIEYYLCSACDIFWKCNNICKSGL